MFQTDRHLSDALPLFTGLSDKSSRQSTASGSEELKVWGFKGFKAKFRALALKVCKVWDLL